MTVKINSFVSITSPYHFHSSLRMANNRRAGRAVHISQKGWLMNLLEQPLPLKIQEGLYISIKLMADIRGNKKWKWVCLYILIYSCIIHTKWIHYIAEHHLRKRSFIILKGGKTIVDTFKRVNNPSVLTFSKKHSKKRTRLHFQKTFYFYFLSSLSHRLRILFFFWLRLARSNLHLDPWIKHSFFVLD